MEGTGLLASGALLASHFLNALLPMRDYTHNSMTRFAQD